MKLRRGRPNVEALPEAEMQRAAAMLDETVDKKELK
jgi:hypothetical protein